MCIENLEFTSSPTKSDPQTSPSPPITNESEPSPQYPLACVVLHYSIEHLVVYAIVLVAKRSHVGDVRVAFANQVPASAQAVGSCVRDARLATGLLQSTMGCEAPAIDFVLAPTTISNDPVIAPGLPVRAFILFFPTQSTSTNLYQIDN